MSEHSPQWTSAELSAQLPRIREAGESKAHEFKEAFPDQAHRLAKSIAALATSDGGYIFIGINDGGELIGLDADTAEKRDDLIERAYSIARTVDPSPIVDIRFAIEASKVVLAIHVGKSEFPVYYYDHRPYIRDGRRSRPAEPQEVQELVWAHPSSEYKRNLERLHFESSERFARQMAEQRQRHSDQMADIHRRSTNRR